MSQPRFPLLPLPPLSPACCFTCQRPRDEDGFFDTGADLDFGGRVYVCGQCIREMARQLGLGDTAERDRLQGERVTALEMALAASRTEAHELRVVLEVGAVGMIENVLMEQLRRQAAAAEQEEGPDAGSETEPDPAADGAGGDGGGEPGDGGGVPARQPVRRTSRSRYRAPAGSGVGGAGGGPGPDAEPPAGPDADGAGDAGQQLAGAPTGT